VDEIALADRVRSALESINLVLPAGAIRPGAQLMNADERWRSGNYAVEPLDDGEEDE